MESKKVNAYSLIPFPVNIKAGYGKFVLKTKTKIQTDFISEEMGEYFKKMLNISTGLNISTIITDQGNETNSCISLKSDSKLSHLGQEGYYLQVKRRNIQISALTPSGIFYGIQTLRQLLPKEIESKRKANNVEWAVPCVEIEDYPQFSWRGFMLDEGRHFLGKDMVKRMLDLMALLKMNVFHWHLADDQGWRIEIKKYPLLTEIGSKRKETQVKGFSGAITDGIPHSGYYTQDEVKEIITYAKDRFITVVPEIDMPGHSLAILASYPELSCTGGPFEVPTKFGIWKDILCIGKEKTFTFLQDMLSEILKLFPSKIIHIGGDEAPVNRWKECPDCQTRIKNEGLKEERELQVYFTNRIAEYLSSRGRNAMVWNDYISENLNKSILGQYWIHGIKNVLGYLRNGRKIVMSRYGYVYLDLDYNITPLKKTYNYNPSPKKLEEEYRKNVLGIEGLSWTEWIPNGKRLDWQTFPRLITVAETGWTPEIKKNYQSFKDRLISFLQRLDIIGVNYAKIEEADPTVSERFSEDSSSTIP